LEVTVADGVEVLGPGWREVWGRGGWEYESFHSVPAVLRLIEEELFNTDVDLLVLVTHNEYAEELPERLAARADGIDVPKNGEVHLGYGDGWVMDFEDCTFEYIYPPGKYDG
jgi:hypothetical protein